VENHAGEVHRIFLGEEPNSIFSEWGDAAVFLSGREVRHIFLEGSVMDLRERHERGMIEGELKRRVWIIYYLENFQLFSNINFCST
jgi:hypothetical protein